MIRILNKAEVEHLLDKVDSNSRIPEEDKSMLECFKRTKDSLTSFFDKVIKNSKEEARKKRLRGLIDYVNSIYNALTSWVVSYYELKNNYDSLCDEHAKLSEEYSLLEEKVKRLECGNEEGNEENKVVERLKKEKKRFQKKYESFIEENEELRDRLKQTKSALRLLRRTSTRDVQRLKKVLKDYFNYKERDFKQFKSREELFQYLVSRVELEVASLKLKYLKSFHN